MNLTPQEIELLEVLNGDREAGPWGACVSVCLESLQECGLVTRGSRPEITAEGRARLAASRGVTVVNLKKLEGATYLSFWHDGKVAAISIEDGALTYSGDLPVAESARLFFNALSTVSKECRHEPN